MAEPTQDLVDRWYLAGGLYSNSTVGIAVAAIELFMWIYSVQLYLELPRVERRGRERYLVVSFVMVSLACMSAVSGAINVYNVLLETHLPSGNVDEVWEKYDNSLLDHMEIMGLMVQRWVGDLLLIYRCYIIWQDRLAVAILPVLVFLASFGISLRPFIPLHGWKYRSHHLRTVDAFVYMSLHILVTALISIRLMRARRRLTRTLGLAIDDRVYTSVVAMLVESAAAIAVVTIPYATTNIVAGWTAYQVYTVFAVGYNTVISLAPQLIIFRVASGRSWVRRPESFSDPVSHDLRFHESQVSEKFEP
ncbi:hypothetical protein CC1G_11263 [Coprinopsis cinerea okayama7|uniref:Uncharacterized protein n=1 Tax=Coprinopsis cinerea (strain Okayama-7 / 130 / ATCC MYA-4618 / FGSC 9003) TaxID=240176 RepID=A8PDK4_COPC7|nr:hypothetical protein CC1G_11263 [Coprinopsis cinerea okayama7\|eukprot:XP_001840615.1 hypothetical protein CC1G_11263 [Coprinopsis cinerea okayama7\